MGKSSTWVVSEHRAQAHRPGWPAMKSWAKSADRHQTLALKKMMFRRINRLSHLIRRLAALNASNPRGIEDQRWKARRHSLNPNLSDRADNRHKNLTHQRAHLTTPLHPKTLHLLESAMIKHKVKQLNGRTTPWQGHQVQEINQAHFPAQALNDLKIIMRIARAPLLPPRSLSPARHRPKRKPLPRPKGKQIALASLNAKKTPFGTSTRVWRERLPPANKSQNYPNRSILRRIKSTSGSGTQRRRSMRIQPWPRRPAFQTRGDSPG